MSAQPERVFIHRLARELGMSISRLHTEMDSREIAEWMAFFSYEADQEAARQKKEADVLGKKLVASTQIYNAGLKARKG